MSGRNGPRRVVTGLRDGRSAFLSDGPPENLHHYEGWPGHMTSVIWATAALPDLPSDGFTTPAPAQMRILPAPGETRLMVVRFPPDSMFADPRFDPARLDQELTKHLDGLHQCFEPDSPGMHTTDSLDYDIVLDGEIWLELDDGEATRLQQGDIVVQGGVRHAWRNRSDRTATMAFVLIGAMRQA